MTHNDVIIGRAVTSSVKLSTLTIATHLLQFYVPMEFLEPPILLYKTWST